MSKNETFVNISVSDKKSGKERIWVTVSKNIGKQRLYHTYFGILSLCLAYKDKEDLGEWEWHLPACLKEQTYKAMSWLESEPHSTIYGCPLVWESEA